MAGKEAFIGKIYQYCVRQFAFGNDAGIYMEGFGCVSGAPLQYLVCRKCIGGMLAFGK